MLIDNTSTRIAKLLNGGTLWRVVHVIRMKETENTYKILLKGVLKKSQPTAGEEISFKEIYRRM